MDYFIIVSLTLAGVYFHWWLYVRIGRWAARDLALSLAGTDAGKKAYMLRRLAEAHTAKVKRRDLSSWLERAAADYRAP